jgi:methylmalonyl-CoA mutase C-terminal domain/subunit
MKKSSFLASAAGRAGISFSLDTPPSVFYKNIHRPIEITARDPNRGGQMQDEKRVRILMAKFGEGYEKSVVKLALAFRESGFEIIYTETQTPEAIVTSAIQEDVDHIGITTLPGANIDDIRKVMELLEKADARDIGVTAGGFLSYEDIPRLKEVGIVQFFPSGTTIQELIEWARTNIKQTH